MTTRRRLSAYILLLVIVLSSCTGGKKEIRTDMRDVAQSTRDLYAYVWSPERFADPANTSEILSLLDRLRTDFHSVERDRPASRGDAGFAVALDINRELLSDARKRLAQGEADYANWRLRGLLTSCIACHTQYEVPAIFRPAIPESSAPDTFSSRLALGEFYLASRQPDRASRLLFALAQGETSVPYGSENALRAMKLWLVDRIRSGANLSSAATELTRLLRNARTLDPDTRAIFVGWASDLRATRRSKSLGLAEARDLLDDVREPGPIGRDDRHLVKTLRAAGALHQILVHKDSPIDTRREATHLLGLAYSRIGIATFEVFREMYLEQCIREFPATEEARECFLLLKSNLELEASGASTINLDDEDRRRLEDLHNLAYSGPYRGS